MQYIYAATQGMRGLYLYVARQRMKAVYYMQQDKGVGKGGLKPPPPPPTVVSSQCSIIISAHNRDDE